MNQNLLKRCEGHIIHLSQSLQAQKTRSFQFQKQLNLSKKESSINQVRSQFSTQELIWLRSQNYILKENAQRNQIKIKQQRHQIKNLKSSLQQKEAENTLNLTRIEKLEQQTQYLLETIFNKQSTLQAWNQTGKEADLKLHYLATDKAQLKYNLDLYITKCDELIHHNQELAYICSKKNEQVNKQWEEIKQLTIKLKKDQITKKRLKSVIQKLKQTSEQVQQGQKQGIVKIEKVLVEKQELENKIKQIHQISQTQKNKLKEKLKECKQKQEMLVQKIQFLTFEFEKISENYKKLEESTTILNSKHKSLKAYTQTKNKQHNQLLQSFKNIKKSQKRLWKSYSDKLKKLQQSLGQFQQGFQQKLIQKQQDHQKEIETMKINHENELENSRKLIDKLQLQNSAISYQFKQKQENFLELTPEKLCFSKRNQYSDFQRDDISSIQQQIANKDQQILCLKTVFEDRLKEKIKDFSLKTSIWKERLRKRLQDCQGLIDSQTKCLISDLTDIIQSIN